MSRWSTRRGWLRYAVGASFGLSVILGLTLLRVCSTFNATVQTETLSFRSGGAPMSRWPLRGARVFAAGSRTPAVFSGMLEIRDSVDVSVQRIASGPLFIRLRAGNRRASVGRLYHESDDLAAVLPAVAEIVIDSVPQRAERGENIVLQFAGHASVGAELGFMTRVGAPVLREGNITMLGGNIIGPGKFDAGSFRLQPGDYLHVENPLSPAIGFIVADERPALTGIVRVLARSAQVDRAGGTGYRLSMSLFDQIWLDPVVRSFAVLVSSIIGLFLFLVEKGPIIRSKLRISR